MTPVRSIKNQYLGINAHLHSTFQSEGVWDSFHTAQITYLTAALKAKLLPMGYTAESQESLQIRRLGEPVARPESDVTIYDTDRERSLRPFTGHVGGSQRVAILDIMTLREELSPYRAIAIYELAPGKPGAVSWWHGLVSRRINRRAMRLITRTTAQLLQAAYIRGTDTCTSPR
jgi:hypothetical protein